ncbi:16S rRNA (adenine(1518)-N(6)/adenine(1519)-N(6))-dimethyltransferase RsmA [Marinagarivorans algicola]|uniref:16S rRNA (adenine(1518)-N(6)/adenine(1519)-N(6))- dimethyltransferase RsmA n=1 Tax=Marinagarivorans algicola TaxID=1513270 RepID=UPI0006BA07CA|nr:16S rRNA (adenine(1518)-N(6)/adenine(1519)-N(6))-dimethyltransferase RsmA [Marinagarivorans algicola]
MSYNEKNHRARKRFGQNFLHDQRVISHIVRSIRPSATDNMVEIGPGKGAITSLILDVCPNLNVVELDRDLIPILREKFGHLEHFHINEADALKFDFAQLGSAERPLRIVGNLPYNISTPLIFHLLSYSDRVQDMHFMLQKEVVVRMAAKENENNYGRLSIMTQYLCEVEHLFDVGPECFDPQPKVDSAIVRLTPYKTPPHPADDHKTLDLVVRTAFSQRRKTLRNTLKTLLSSEELEALSIDPSKRPENLALSTYVTIANYLFNQSPQSLAAGDNNE